MDVVMVSVFRPVIPWSATFSSFLVVELMSASSKNVRLAYDHAQDHQRAGAGNDCQYGARHSRSADRRLWLPMSGVDTDCVAVDLNPIGRKPCCGPAVGKSRRENHEAMGDSPTRKAKM
uniref:hypothetical protein n=1 Tax=Pseudogemmobacter bohemicus TaxID=2250708 RepID=UPI001E372D43|nr:hypothetical protein [Pseudogemmobacter bohemicus]